MKKQFNSRIDEQLQRDIKSASADRGMNIEEALDEALRAWVGKPRSEDEETAAKLLAWYQSESGGPVERRFREVVRDLINDKL